jgi:hypothetical protein
MTGSQPGPETKPRAGPEHAWEIEDTIDQLLDQLPEVTSEDALLMAQLWQEEDATERRRAWARAKASIERANLGEVLDRAREDVGFWMQATRSDFQGISGLLGQEGDHVSVRRAAAPAVLDAVAALLAERDLQASDFDLLTRPWRIATEYEKGTENDSADGNGDGDGAEGEADDGPDQQAED